MQHGFSSVAPRESQTDLAIRIAELSTEQWGSQRGTVLIGRDPSMIEAQHRLLQFAQADSPLLLCGETGTGKELFARALYLLSRRRRKPFLAVNCAQYHDGQLLASELFGHRRGSFTGAVSDHRGVFDEADGGVVFLDEIGELSLPAQAMLLRALSEGEIVPVGDSRAHPVDVRIVAATSRDLRPMLAKGLFREDLYFRLRFLQVRVPALRERGNDWRLLTSHFMQNLNFTRRDEKIVSPDTLDLLGSYRWPGNVRELRSIVETGFHLSGGSTIRREHIAGALEESGTHETTSTTTSVATSSDSTTFVVPGRGAAVLSVSAYQTYARMRNGGESFWDVVYQPFMSRDLNRAECQAVLDLGLAETHGSYKRLLAVLHVDAGDYLRFMDFLRHHRLKPSYTTAGPLDALVLDHPTPSREPLPRS
ncbi:MAG: sigma 54-interacting transcriptional regulator [bacterium]